MDIQQIICSLFSGFIGAFFVIWYENYKNRQLEHAIIKSILQVIVLHTMKIHQKEKYPSIVDSQRFSLLYDMNIYKYICKLGVENYKNIFLFFEAYYGLKNYFDRRNNSGYDQKETEENIELEKDTLKNSYNKIMYKLYDFYEDDDIFRHRIYRKQILDLHGLDESSKINKDSEFYAIIKNLNSLDK